MQTATGSNRKMAALGNSRETRRQMKGTHGMNTTHGILGRLAVALAAVSLASAQANVITAGFDGGNGTTLPDQFTGTAGNGWTTGWTTSSSGAASFDSGYPTVDNTSPVTPGAGNYLDVRTSVAASSGTRQTGTITLRRDYTDYGKFALDEFHTVSFDVRFDAGMGTADWESGTEFLEFSDGEQTTATWRIGLQHVGNVPRWYAVNAGTKINSTMSAIAGTVYHVTIQSDPATSSYIASIDNGTTVYTWGSYPFRQASSAADGYFVIHRAFANDTAAIEPFDFSLDNFSITPIPEPTSLALLALGGLALLRRRRRA